MGQNYLRIKDWVLLEDALGDEYRRLFKKQLLKLLDPDKAP